MLLSTTYNPYPYHTTLCAKNTPGAQFLRAHIDLDLDLDLDIDIDIASSPAPAPIKMVCPISITKFVGTISLGLLTVSNTQPQPP